MRYTEEKETKKSPFTQTVIANNRWARSPYSCSSAARKPTSFSSGNNLWTGCMAICFLFLKLIPITRFVCQRTTRLRLMFHISQERVIGIPRFFTVFNCIQNFYFLCLGDPFSFYFSHKPSFFFFIGSPTPKPPRPGLFHSFPVIVSNRHISFWTRFCYVLQVVRLANPKHLLLPVGEIKFYTEEARN